MKRKVDEGKGEHEEKGGKEKMNLFAHKFTPLGLLHLTEN
jgi:hypothetical protein